ncbi:MAG: hypothetical protein H7319_15900 [Spirosoma sp.]|nr:hypothetical protein [Spirosoma sp.]
MIWHYDDETGEIMLLGIKNEEIGRIQLPKGWNVVYYLNTSTLRLLNNQGISASSSSYATTFLGFVA